MDLRDSTKLFSEKTDIDIAKVIRGFTSEIIEILRKDTDDTELKEIGIRGDCVYAIYSTPTKNDIYDLAIRAFFINTYMNMLNKLLEQRGLPTIKAGIGLATQETLAVKAGRKSSGINNLVWIGEAVSKASKLADLGNKNGINPIVMSSVFHHNYIKIAKKMNPKSESWWHKKYHSDYGTYHHGYVIIIEFDNWIENGMQN